MIRSILSFIDRTTMYRMVLYYLMVLFVAALMFGAVGVLSIAPANLLWSFVVLALVAWMTNEALAWLLGVSANQESFLITVFILVLILPPMSFSNMAGTIAFAFISLWAISSKFLLTVWNKHLFNPAALAVVLSAFLLGIPATWWVGGNVWLLPFVVLGGLMVVHKLRRFDLVLSFFIAALAVVLLTSADLVRAFSAVTLHSALFFLAFAMLTEPLTMPHTRTLRVWYGGIVGLLFAPAVHLGSFFFTPELGLLVGNIFSYVVSPKGRTRLSLVARKKLAQGIYEFVFRPDRRLVFKAGQYLEWTLPGVPFDSRGNRRFFTISSAPEDDTISLGVRFYESPSGFKSTLASVPRGGVISVGSLGGDFTLPKNTKKKLAFIAGGIGVTPFASMARHMVAANESRDAVLLYSSKTASEVAYQGEFSEAARQGLRTVYVLTDEESMLPGAERGFIDAALIVKEIPDFKDRTFYVSGPPGMVNAMKVCLRGLGVSRSHIKTDYFPGLA